MDIESESCRKCFQVEIVCGISSLGLSKYHDSAQKCNILFFSFHELVEISFLIKRLYDFGNVIREIRPVILRGFGVTLSHGITKPSEKELVMRRAVGGWGGAPGQSTAKAQVVLPRVEVPRERCVHWQPGRVVMSENGLTYQRRVVGGQAPGKWSEVCGHGFKMKPLTWLRFSRALVLGSIV